MVVTQKFTPSLQRFAAPALLQLSMGLEQVPPPPPPPCGTQVLPLLTKPVLQTKSHVPALQTAVPLVGALQTMPQSPQLVTLFCRSWQAPPQLVVPSGQQMPFESLVPEGQTQAPPTQPFPPVQTFPHPPQLLLSVCVLTQVLPQMTIPVGHPQTPLVQGLPGGQVLPHAPQLKVSVCVLMQMPPHSVVPGGQTHCPKEQTLFPVH
jgi:hypothetical protein